MDFLVEARWGVEVFWEGWFWLMLMRLWVEHQTNTNLLETYTAFSYENRYLLQLLLLLAHPLLKPLDRRFLPPSVAAPAC